VHLIMYKTGAIPPDATRPAGGGIHGTAAGGAAAGGLGFSTIAFGGGAAAGGGGAAFGSAHAEYDCAVAAARAPCGSVCFEVDHLQQGAGFEFAGEHRGDYEPVLTYNYVGPGLGSYHHKTIEAVRCRTAFIIFMILLVVGGIVGAFLVLFQSQVGLTIVTPGYSILVPTAILVLIALIVSYPLFYQFALLPGSGNIPGPQTVGSLFPTLVILLVGIVGAMLVLFQLQVIPSPLTTPASTGGSILLLIVLVALAPVIAVLSICNTPGSSHQPGSAGYDSETHRRHSVGTVFSMLLVLLAGIIGLIFVIFQLSDQDNFSSQKAPYPNDGFIALVSFILAAILLNFIALFQFPSFPGSSQASSSTDKNSHEHEMHRRETICILFTNLVSLTVTVATAFVLFQSEVAPAPLTLAAIVLAIENLVTGLIVLFQFIQIVKSGLPGYEFETHNFRTLGLVFLIILDLLALAVTVFELFQFNVVPAPITLTAILLSLIASAITLAVLYHLKSIISSESNTPDTGKPNNDHYRCQTVVIVLLFVVTVAAIVTAVFVLSQFKVIPTVLPSASVIVAALVVLFALCQCLAGPFSNNSSSRPYVLPGCSIVSLVFFVIFVVFIVIIVFFQYQIRPTPLVTTSKPYFGSGYDCETGYWNWQAAWSQAQQQYCCAKLGRACPTTEPFNCLAVPGNLETSWSTEKQVWCCSNYGRGCPVPITEPYNCHLGVVATWTEPKKAWCCGNYNIGCRTTSAEPYDCSAGLATWQSGWSESKKVWCCSRYSVGCQTSLPYNCNSGYDNWQTVWSYRQKAWCCAYTGRGCPVVTTLPYDCSAGYNNWQAGWSDQKKQWCCARTGQGCPETTTARSLPFDCFSGYENWQALWSSTKQRWCCAYVNRACPLTTSIATLPYDCYAGYSNSAIEWSDSKKEWCCLHTQRGCPTTRSTTLLPYDCYAGYNGWQYSWTEDKKGWCCQHFQRGCPTTQLTTLLPYNCYEGYSNWQYSWSIAKKSWCCVRYQRGCPETQSTTLQPYDCYAGYNNWQLSWSNAKKEWCCLRYQRGCPTTQSTTLFPFNCMVAYDTWQFSWTLDKKDWCCAHFSRGCPVTTSKPFDCSAGIQTWELGWSKEKKDWCCSHQDIGCPPPPGDGDCKIWGDPHFITFDKAQFVFYRSGDFWIIKSPSVSIQGRFQNTDWTKQNDLTDFSSMTGMVISGAFIGNHKIQIQSFDKGGITCDGQAILTQFGTANCFGVKLEYSDQGQLIDAAMGILPRRVVLLTLPLGIKIEVNRFPNFMNALITSPRLNGLDGLCGNFNGFEKDDRGRYAARRFGDGVAKNELLFPDSIPVHFPLAHINPKKCSPQRQQEAIDLCKPKMTSSPGWTFAECMGDVCQQLADASGEKEG
jgi:hypothetical protein